MTAYWGQFDHAEIRALHGHEELSSFDRQDDNDDFDPSNLKECNDQEQSESTYSSMILDWRDFL
jgi:hypothetical protein